MEHIPDTLRTELELFWKQVYNVTATLKTLAEQLRATRQVNRTLEAQINEHRAHVEQLETQVRSLQEQAQHVEVLQQELSQSQEAIEQLQRALTERERIIVQREHELRQAHTIRAELESLQKLYAQLTEDYRTAQHALEITGELEAENQRLRSRIAELEHERLRSVAEQEEVAYLRTTVEQLRTEYTHALEQLELQTVLSEELNQLREHKAEAEQIIAQLKTELEGKTAELEQLAARYAQGEQTLTSSAPDAHGADRQAELEQQLHQLLEENEKLRHQCTESERVCDELRQQLEERGRELVELRTISEQFHAQRAEVSPEEIARLRREVELGERAAAQQRQQLEILTDEVTHLREQLHIAQQSQQEVEQRIAEAIAPLQIKIEAAEREREHLQEQNRVQRERIRQLEDELRSELERNILLTRRLRQFEQQPSTVQTSLLTEQLERLAAALEILSSSDPVQESFPSMDQLEMLLDRIREILHARQTLQVDPSVVEAVRQARELLQQRLDF